MKTINEITAFAENIYLPKEMQVIVLPICEKIISAFAEEYDKIRKNECESKLIYALADNMGLERDSVMLAVCLMLGADARERYDKAGISKEIYLDSMREITIWAKTCMKMRGHVGLYEYGWIINFLQISIVRLHRLEFHIIPFLKDRTWSKDGITICGRDPVINIHIPEDGSLNHDDVLESYRRAYRYFGCTGKRAFVCHSWLLYPGNYEFLSEDSNIRKFMDDFDIINRRDTKWDGDLWRVFGPCFPCEDTSKLPRETKLQRDMIRYLNEHDYTTGNGYGIFLFDGEKIIK